MRVLSAICLACLCLTAGWAVGQETAPAKPKAAKPLAKPVKKVAKPAVRPAPEVAAPEAVAPSVAETEASEMPAIGKPDKNAELAANEQLLLQALQLKEQALADEQKKNEELKKELQALSVEIEQLRAEAKTNQAVSNSEKATLSYNLGCIYKAAREYVKSEEAFLRALDFEPNDAQTHYNLAILYQDDLKNPAKAKPHYERFLELAPDDIDADRVREWLSGLK